MKQKDEKVYTQKAFEKLIKPKMPMQILHTLILLGPYLNLLFMVTVMKDYSNLVASVIMTGVTLPLLTLDWARFIKLRREYKGDAKIIYDEIQKSKTQDDTDA